LIDVILGKLLGPALNKLFKRLVAKIIEKRSGIGFKIRLKLVRALDKCWLALRRLLCDPKCWVVTEDYLVTEIQKELIKASVRGLKKLRDED
jgi:hypothetical protein